MKTLIAYGTRYGATAGTSKEVGAVLSEKGFEVKIANVQTEKIKDISDYDLVIAASGMKLDHWVAEAEDFLKKFQKELVQKKHAIFVSSALQELFRRQGNQHMMDRAWKKYLFEKAEQYSLKPISFGLFGGVIDYNSMGFYTQKLAFEDFKNQFEKVGIKESRPGFIDTRDWTEIRNWANELAKKVST
jgi:menaquinone-dependent protoporphyrinogen IX oxidase